MWDDLAGPAAATTPPLGPAPAPAPAPARGARRAADPACLRCGFPVDPRPLGCKNPCGNCGTVYPLGDCSD